jgi:hypothetical protein
VQNPQLGDLPEGEALSTSRAAIGVSRAKVEFKKIDP